MSLRELYDDLEPTTRLRMAAVVIVILLLALAYSFLNDRIVRLQKKRASREAAVAEMLLLSHQFRLASADAQRLNNRLAAVKTDDSPARLIEETGLKGKNIQVKPLKGEERQGVLEDAAEVRIEGLSANDAINLLYRLEKGAKPVVIKKANLKTRYDDPAKLDVTVTMALLKSLPQERK